MSTKAISIVGIVLVLLGGAVYFSRSPGTSVTTPSEGTASSTPINLGALDAVVEDSAGATSTIQVLPGDRSLLPKPIPSLTRAFIPPSPEFNAQAKKILEDKYAVYVKELTVNPSNINTWLQIGILQRMVHDTAGALESWLYASRLNSKAAVPHKNLADLYMYDIHDNVKSESEWKIAIALDTKDTTAYRGLFDLYRLAYTEKASLAPGVLLSGLKVTPDNIDLMLPLAGYYKEMKDTTNARIYFEKALAEARVRGNTQLAAQIQAELDTL
mgnify:FL=1